MKDKAPPPKEQGEKVPIWIVSFADMITLLLSFFVMLTTFSSYSKEDLSKFAGVWAQLADAHVNAAAGKTGAEFDAEMAKGLESYGRRWS